MGMLSRRILGVWNAACVKVLAQVVNDSRLIYFADAQAAQEVLRGDQRVGACYCSCSFS